MIPDLITENGYEHARQLPDGRWIGILRLMFTSGLVVGLEKHGYSYRYCYETSHEAIAAITAWDGTGHPPGNWIKRKGEGGDLRREDAT